MLPETHLLCWIVMGFRSRSCSKRLMAVLCLLLPSAVHHDCRYSARRTSRSQLLITSTEGSAKSKLD